MHDALEDLITEAGEALALEARNEGGPIIDDPASLVRRMHGALVNMSESTNRLFDMHNEAAQATDSLLLIRVYRDQDGTLHADHSVTETFWSDRDHFDALVLAHAATGCCPGHRMTTPRDRPVAPLGVMDFQSVTLFDPERRDWVRGAPAGTAVEIFTGEGTWVEAVIGGPAEEHHQYAFLGPIVPVVVRGITMLWPVDGVRPAHTEV